MRWRLGRCLLLYTRLNGEPEQAEAEAGPGPGDAEDQVRSGNYASPAAGASGVAASTPSSVRGADKATMREAMLHRNEEIALLRAVNEELREKNEEISGKLNVVEQVVDDVAPPLDGPSDTVRSLAERMMGLKKMLQSTKHSLNPHASESPGRASKAAEEVRRRRCCVSVCCVYVDAGGDAGRWMRRLIVAGLGALLSRV